MVEIKYEALTSHSLGNGELQYVDENGGTQIIGTLHTPMPSNPWTYTFTVKSGRFVSLQLMSSESGSSEMVTNTVRVYRNGELWLSYSNSGEVSGFVTALIQGIIP